jgi:EAL domain-containing protein (putative c-di-GMP-specific phosphodiesterase class I)
MGNDGRDAAIVRWTAELGNNLGLRVVAEGVESEQAWKRLTAYGCHLAQGSYLSQPLSAPALRTWLARREIGD